MCACRVFSSRGGRGTAHYLSDQMSTLKESSRAREAASLPNSRKDYVEGGLHRNIWVPFREINLARTKTMSGEIEANEPVRAYDTSRPWANPGFHGDV